MSVYAPAKNSHDSMTLAQSRKNSSTGLRKLGSSFCTIDDMNTCRPPEHIISMGNMMQMAR